MSSHTTTTAPAGDFSTTIRNRLGVVGEAVKQGLYRVLESLAEHGDARYPNKDYTLTRWPF
jgi:hypothetical protein